MPTYTPFEQEVLEKLQQITSDVSELKSDVSELKSDVSELKSDVSGLKSDVSGLKSDVSELKSDVRDVKSRLTSLEDIVLDTREELRADGATTRALLNQAFEHISDQMASKDQQPIPSMIFRSRQRDIVNH